MSQPPLSRQGVCGCWVRAAWALGAGSTSRKSTLQHRTASRTAGKHRAWKWLQRYRASFCA